MSSLAFLGRTGLAITEVERKVCGFRWRTFDAMIEELEDLRGRGGQALGRADPEDSVMYYEAAQHMVTFFLQTGEIVREFGLNNDPERQSRFMQMRFEIASDLTMAHLSSMNKNTVF